MAVRHAHVQPLNPYEPIPLDALERSLVDRFERIVERYSDRPAVKSPGVTLAYGQMNQLANRLARTLLQLTQTTSEPIILILSPTAYVPAGMFGVLKAGHYFIPLDAANPPARLAALIRDAQARIVVTARAAYDVAAQAAAGGTIVCIDELDQNLPADNPGLAIMPNQPALRYYTSGTTGQPRGWTSTHHQVLDAARDNTDLLHITAEDCFSHVVSYSFAASRKVLFDALLNGASVAVRDLKTEGFAGLESWLEREGVTIFCATPSLFRHVVATLAPGGRVLPLRLLFMTGEPVRQHDLTLFRQRLAPLAAPGCLLANMFGATETGAICQLMLDAQTEIDGPIVPVGFPVHGNTVHLLDEAGNAVAAGDVGELGVSGPHAVPNEARPDDIANTSFRRRTDGMWLYHTGDLGRLRLDGLYEHLGRRDFQLKINGQRVEPAEVEEALLQHADIHEAVVVGVDAPGDNGYGETRLVAYVVANRLPLVSDLRQFLTDRLPDYMVPHTFVPIDAIPLGATGKVDRSALPVPDSTPPAATGRQIADPLTPTEERLRALWRDILGIDGISIEDHFFDLGGTSLIAAQMLSQVEKAFGKAIPFSTLEHYGSIARLAVFLATENSMERPSPVVAIRSQGSLSPLFCCPGFHGYAFKLFPLARHLDAELPVYVIQRQGVDQPSRLHTTLHWTLESMASEAIEEIRRIQPRGPYHLCGHSYGGIVAFEMARQLVASGERVESLFIFDAQFSPGFPTRKPYPYFVALMGYHLLRGLIRPSGTVSRSAAIKAVIGRLTSRTRAELKRMRESKVERLNRDLYRYYVIRPYSGRVTYFTARAGRRDDGREAQWAEVALGGMEIVDVPGSHTGMIEEPHVRVLAERVNGYLRAAHERAHQRGA